MRHFSLVATVTCLGVIGFAIPANSNGPHPKDEEAERPSLPARIALLDTHYIFKNHPEFSESMSKLRAEVEQAVDEGRRQRERTAELVERIGALEGQPGGEKESERLEQELVNILHPVGIGRPYYLQREAEIYASFDRQISAEVEKYASAHGFDIVLRYRHASIDVRAPGRVQALINQRVVWHKETCDITQAILQRMLVRRKMDEPHN